MTETPEIPVDHVPPRSAIPFAEARTLLPQGWTLEQPTPRSLILLSPAGDRYVSADDDTFHLVPPPAAPGDARRRLHQKRKGSG